MIRKILQILQVTVISFFSVLIGGQIGFAFYYIFERIFVGPPKILYAVWACSGFDIFIWWLVFVLPLIIYLNSRKKAYSTLVITIFSGIYGILGYRIVAPLTVYVPRYLLYLGFGCEGPKPTLIFSQISFPIPTPFADLYAWVVGVVSGWIYSGIMKRVLSQELNESI